MSSYLEAFSKWFKLKIYQLEVTMSVYIFTPIEKFIFCTFTSSASFLFWLTGPFFVNSYPSTLWFISSPIPSTTTKGNQLTALPPQQTPSSSFSSPSPSSPPSSTFRTTCNSSPVAPGSTCTATPRTRSSMLFRTPLPSPRAHCWDRRRLRKRWAGRRMLRLELLGSFKR